VSDLARRYAAHGLTRAEFARRVGAAYQTVWRWERGQCVPTGEHVAAIERVLGVSGDPELDAMRSLAKLGNDARSRVLRWAAARWDA
jgi:transcriptional regulator with XRE-family HTH domain